MSEKNKRSKNFSDREIDLLLDLVKERKNILENKKTDAVTTRDKENCWKEISNEFNQRSGKFERNWTELRMKYSNLKKTCKKKFSEEKKYSTDTGGGPSKPSTITSVDFEIKSMLGDQVEGMESNFDSDFIALQGTNQTEVMEIAPQNEAQLMECHQLDGFPVTVIEIPASTSSTKDEEVQESENLSNKINWGDIKNIRQPVSKKLKIKKNIHTNIENSAVGKKIVNLAGEKAKLLELQKEVLQKQLQFSEEEHKLKMKNMEEEHHLKLELLQLKIKCAKNELKKMLSQQD